MNEYSLMAGTYDFFLTPFLMGMRKRVLAISKSLAPESIVDLCCGTGHQLKILSKSGFNNLTCVDLSEEMLHVAAKGKHAPDCLLGDASETGLIDASFDMVMISLAIHEKTHEKAAEVLAEAHRILKPRAHLIVCDYKADGSVPRYVSAAIRFIESMAGGEHFANYKDYMRTNGLSELFDETKFRISARYPAIAGGATVEVWEKLSG